MFFKAEKTILIRSLTINLPVPTVNVATHDPYISTGRLAVNKSS